MSHLMSYLVSENWCYEKYAKSKVWYFIKTCGWLMNYSKIHLRLSMCHLQRGYRKSFKAAIMDKARLWAIAHKKAFSWAEPGNEYETTQYNSLYLIYFLEAFWVCWFHKMWSSIICMWDIFAHGYFLIHDIYIIL